MRHTAAGNAEPQFGNINDKAKPGLGTPGKLEDAELIALRSHIETFVIHC